MKCKNKELVSKNNLIDTLKNRKIEVLMTLGAGDIGAMTKDIAKAVFNV